MKDLRLLQIVPSLESGGVEQGTIDVANYIAGKGFKSVIVSNGGKMITHLNNKIVNHINLPVHSKNPYVIFKNIKKIRKIILNNNINLIHVRSRAPAWSAYYANKKYCKSVSTFHNIYGHQNFLKKYYNSSLKKVDKIVAISDYVKNSIAKIYKINKRNISIIHRGTDTDFFNNESDNQVQYLNFISKHNIPSDKKIILFPGRLSEWKGQIELLEIINKLDLDNKIFYFIGDDKNQSYRKKLENEIYKKNLQSHCKILGNLSKINMKFMYKSADLILSAPKKAEGFCRVISEGLAMKKIVLCYNYGGAKEQIDDLDDLYSVEPHNKKIMVEKINISLNLSNKKKEELGKVAREHIINNFSKKMMLEKYHKFYKKTIL